MIIEDTCVVKFDKKNEVWVLNDRKKLLGMVSVNDEKLNVNKSNHSPKKKKKHQKTSKT
jgi:hypothetical protein